MAPVPEVLVLTTTFPAKPGDGTPEFVLTLARSMRPAKVTVLTPRVAGSARRETIDGIEVRRIAYFPRRYEQLADDAIMPAIRAKPSLALQAPFLVAAMLLATWRAVRTLRPDVVNAHWIVPAGLIARVLRMFGGPPYVVTVHGADAYALRGRAAHVLKQFVIDAAAAVLPVSTDIARVLQLPQDTPVLRMGVDGTEIRRRVGERAPRPGQLLFVGRLAEKKGVDVLLEAVAQVPDASLTILGDGPDRAALEARASALAVADRVTFLGRRPKDDVLAEMRVAVAVVIPSRIAADGDMEGTPVVLAEAMGAGVPVVASDIAGMAECIDDRVTGLLVPPGDVAALADALRTIVDGDIDLRQLASEAMAAAERDLDIRRVGERYGEILASAVT